MVFLVGRESPFFDREKARRGFEENKENLDDVNGFERLVNDSRFLTFTIRTAMSDRFLFIKARPITFFIWADTEYAKTSRMRGRGTAGGGYVPGYLCRHKALKRRYLPEKGRF